MGLFNYIGLTVVCIIMIPNIVFAVKCKNGFDNSYHNKFVEVAEQVGRFSCFALMIFNIPHTYFGFFFHNAIYWYIGGEALLCLIYCGGWMVLWQKSGKLRALLLSITPSLMFMFSGIMLLNVPLMVAAVIFAPSHIILSYKNAVVNNGGTA